MSLLDHINAPAELKALSRTELTALAAEIRERLIEVCAVNGGHVGANLGVV